MQGIPGLDGAQSLSDLANQIPNIVSNFLGYSVIPQVLSQNQLTDGAMFNTTSRLKQGNSVNGVPTLQALSFRTSGGMTQVAPCLACMHRQTAFPCPQNVSKWPLCNITGVERQVLLVKLQPPVRM